MRKRPTLTLIVGLSLWSCGGPVGPANGTLAISTSTAGDDPDPDGFQVTNRRRGETSGTPELLFGPAFKPTLSAETKKIPLS